MHIAQKHYEGLSVGSHGQMGLITYMRTDSTRVSETATTEARGWLEAKYGKEYLPSKPPVYGKKKDAQDAHEAVRPSLASLAPEEAKPFLSNDQYKLYDLTSRRFMASQMEAALYLSLITI